MVAAVEVAATAGPVVAETQLRTRQAAGVDAATAGTTSSRWCS